ncbi:type II secretion system F family protein [Microbispora sp. NPDC049125]|uniref:type II secretion system F family protein n=1 Tax=Microbispora sp. NPDC049125 TaxID=3154929 RepID=UPI0034663DD3
MSLLAGLLVVLVGCLWPAPRSAADRLRAITVRTVTAGALSPEPLRAHALRAGSIVAAPLGFAGFLLVGGVPGLVVGLLLAGGALAAVHRREPAEVRRRRERMTADLPFAVDLVVAGLRAGRPVSAAVETAAEAVGGPLGQRLASVGAQVRLGAGPETAWAAVAGDPSLAALGRTMIRAVESGAPVAEVLTRVADDARQAARAASAAAARKVGVQVVAPLGLCFLPAFVFLGIIPVVAALAAQILLP